MSCALAYFFSFQDQSFAINDYITGLAKCQLLSIRMQTRQLRLLSISTCLTLNF